VNESVLPVLKVLRGAQGAGSYRFRRSQFQFDVFYRSHRDAASHAELRRTLAPWRTSTLSTRRTSSTR